MYLWSLLGYDIVAGPTAHGVCSDAASAMRMGEPRVKDGSVFLCIVEEVRLRISVGGLETTYQGTGAVLHRSPQPDPAGSTGRP